MKSKIVALSKNQDFKNLLKGRKISNKYSIVYYGKLSYKNNKKLNISFVVKKKIGNAVKRNRIKRRLKNIMNDANKTLNLNLRYSYLLIARSAVLKDSYEIIKQNLFTDFGKIK